MNNLKKDENIIFYFKEEEEEEKDDLKETDFKKMMDEFEGLSSDDNNGYGSDELFYQEYTIKDLFKICNYYGIDKHIKSSKCKKTDIISTLVYFESLPENREIVQQRNKMWSYLMEMLNDKKMQKYIYF